MKPSTWPLPHQQLPWQQHQQHMPHALCNPWQGPSQCLGQAKMFFPCYAGERLVISSSYICDRQTGTLQPAVVIQIGMGEQQPEAARALPILQPLRSSARCPAHQQLPEGLSPTALASDGHICSVMLASLTGLVTEPCGDAALAAVHIQDGQLDSGLQGLLRAVSPMSRRQSQLAGSEGAQLLAAVQSPRTPGGRTHQRKLLIKQQVRVDCPLFRTERLW